MRGHRPDLFQIDVELRFNDAVVGDRVALRQSQRIIGLVEWTESCGGQHEAGHPGERKAVVAEGDRRGGLHAISVSSPATSASPEAARTLLSNLRSTVC